MATFNVLALGAIGAASIAISETLGADHEAQSILLIVLEHLVAMLLVGQLYIQSWWVVDRLVRTRGTSITTSYFTTSRKKSYSMTGDRDPEISYSSTYSNTGNNTPSSPGSRMINITFGSKRNNTAVPSNSASSTPSAADEERKRKKKKIGSIKFLLSHDQTLDLFMLHLKSEFQAEILLSLIEFTQFRRLVSLNMDSSPSSKGSSNGSDIVYDDAQNGKIVSVAGKLVYDNSSGRNRGESSFGYHKLELSPGCPYSSILKNDVPDEILEQYQDVEKSRRVLELKYRAHLLHRKYVCSGWAEHEINIGWQLRKHLDAKFKDLNLLMADPAYSRVEDFKEIWSECMEEQYKYCNIVITRFKSTEEFRRIVDYYADTVEVKPEVEK